MNDKWKKNVVTSSKSIREVLTILNETGLQIVLVSDNGITLNGVVTDGDIRRGLINDVELSDPVHKIMNSSPITAKIGTSNKELVDIMEKNSILSIPLINNEKLVGLETLHRVLNISQKPNPVFIMAGGLGTRLRPLTDRCPKPMLKVGDKPLLEMLLSQFLKAGFKNIYISTHYMPELITDYFGDGSAWGANIRYVHEETPLGTGGALGLLPADIPALPLIMINGDVMTTVDFERLLAFHNEHQPAATMCVREYDYQIPYGVISGDGHRIIEMKEKPIQRYFVNAGIYVVSPTLFMNVPSQQHIDMPTLLEQQIADQQDVLMFPIHEYWLDIGRMDDFNRAQLDIKGLV